MVEQFTCVWVCGCVQPRGGSGGGVTTEEIIGRTARDIQGKIPEEFDVPVLRKRLSAMNKDGAPTPVQVCVRLCVSRS